MANYGMVTEYGVLPLLLELVRSSSTVTHGYSGSDTGQYYQQCDRR